MQALEEVQLQHNHFKGPLPRSLGELILVRHFNMSYNNLSQPLPEEIGGMKSLIQLDLQQQETGLSSFIPSSLANLTQIDIINLEFNQLEGTPPLFLANPKYSPMYTGTVGQAAVHMQNNPFWCPLPMWVLNNFPGVECLHCPGDEALDFSVLLWSWHVHEG